MSVGCDNHVFNEIFRNPYIVKIAEMDTLKSDQWYEFKTDIKALNRRQVIRIDFLGSNPSELDFEVIEYDANNIDSHNRFYSKHFPNKDIIFDVMASNTKGEEYTFHPSGQSSGIRFSNNSNINMRGELINSIKIKSNLDHKNIKLTWISSTGK